MFSEPLAFEESERRNELVRSEEANFHALRRSSSLEASAITEEQLGELFVREPRERRLIADDGVGALSQMHRFFWVRFCEDLLRCCVLGHRQGAWFLWAKEAAQRRETECRFHIELEAWEALLRLQSAMRPTHTSIASSVSRRQTRQTLEREQRLLQLRADRERGVFAVKVADLQLMHDAERARIEWREAQTRRELLSFAGIADCEL